MAGKSVFTHTVKWVTNEYGDIVALPDESQLRMLESELAALEPRMKAQETKLKELTERAKSVPEEQKETATGEVQGAQYALGVLLGRMMGLREMLAQGKGALEHYGKDAKTWTFQMHRWSWVERELSKEEARITNEDGSVKTDEAKLTLALLARCIDSWSLKGKVVSQESIDEELPAGVIDRLFAVLRARSEASIESLPFPAIGIGDPGLAFGKPGIAA